MSSTEICAVVFDLDGLMFNTEVVFNESGRELLRRRGKEPHPRLFHSMMGRRAHEAFTVMIEMMELSESIEELQEESETIFNSLLDDILQPMPGLMKLLDHIEECQLPKMVATSSDRNYVGEILGRYELNGRFHFKLTAEDVSQGKPHPEIYLKASEVLGVRPENMLVLEDSENGTKAAASAGAHVISVPHEMSHHHDFSSARAIAQSLDDPLIYELLA